MTLAVGPDVDCNGVSTGYLSLSQATSSSRLDECDLQVLVAWLGHARTRGIDAIMDLTVRPWNVSGAEAILGVFESHNEQASWLIVRCVSGWTVARCADGFVSNASIFLAEILDLIDADLPG